MTWDRLQFPWLKPQSIEFTDWSRRVIHLPSCTVCAIQSIGRNTIYALPATLPNIQSKGKVVGFQGEPGSGVSGSGQGQHHRDDTLTPRAPTGCTRGRALLQGVSPNNTQPQSHHKQTSANPQYSIFYTITEQYFPKCQGQKYKER